MKAKLNCLLMKSRWILRRNKQSTMIKLKVNHMSLMSGKKKIIIKSLDNSWNSVRLMDEVARSILQSPLFFL